MITQVHKSCLFFVLSMFVLGYVILLGKLAFIQIIWHSYFKTIACQQYDTTMTVIPERGNILDRSGSKHFAYNNDSISAFIVPKKLKNRDAVVTFLKQYFPAAYERLAHNWDKHFIYIKRRLTAADIDLIKQAQLEDIALLQEPSRYYPLPCAACVVGMTDIDNKGILGIELVYDGVLAGKGSVCRLQKDARSGHFYFEKVAAQEMVAAQDIQLTLDYTLQFLANQELEKTVRQYHAREGMVLVMNPDNGHIVVACCYPYFDPHDIGLLDLEHTKNRIVTQCYELGSVVKMFVALAALQEGVVTCDELIDCKNSKTAFIDGRKINTVHAQGIVPFTQVFTLSNNIGMAQIAQRLGTTLYDHYVQLGFGKKTDLSWPGQQSGFINPPDHWSAQSLISLSYGYEISMTVLQLATALCLIARDGCPVKPVLLLNNHTDQVQAANKPLYDKRAIDAVKMLLEQTTMHGTAKKAAIAGYKVMSKTGTANMLIDGQYCPDKNIYTCAGIVQKDAYQRVIVVFIKQADRPNLYASTVAAPFFERIAQHLLIHDKVL